MRYLRQLALPAGFIVLGVSTLSATAASPLGNDVANYPDPAPSRRTQSIAPSSSTTAEDVSYIYDQLGRLVKVQHTGMVNNNVVANYSYDKAGNRTNVDVTGAP